MTSLFLTGSSGFIGRAFLAVYADKFSKIVLPMRREADFDLPSNATVVRISGTPASMTEAFVKNPCDVILNVAAYGIMPGHRDVKLMTDTNVIMPKKLMEAALKTPCQGFVQIGSMSEYAAPKGTAPTKETDPLNIDEETYGGSKALATAVLKEAAKEGSLNFIGLRLFGVFGPGEASHRLLPSLHRNLSAGQRVPMSAGIQIRDFIYIKDVIEAIYLAAIQATKEAQINDVFNIGSGEGVAVKDFATQFCQSVGCPTELLGFGDLPMRDTDVAYMTADISKTKSILEWSAKWPLSKAMADYKSTLP